MRRILSYQNTLSYNWLSNNYTNIMQCLQKLQNQIARE